jgi:hypothetical protein
MWANTRLNDHDHSHRKYIFMLRILLLSSVFVLVLCQSNASAGLDVWNCNGTEVRIYATKPERNSYTVQLEQVITTSGDVHFRRNWKTGTASLNGKPCIWGDEVPLPRPRAQRDDPHLR